MVISQGEIDSAGGKIKNFVLIMLCLSCISVCQVEILSKQLKCLELREEFKVEDISR